MAHTILRMVPISCDFQKRKSRPSFRHLDHFCVRQDEGQIEVTAVGLNTEVLEILALQQWAKDPDKVGRVCGGTQIG
jgi:hypothetical protein